jgi:hypothetical protein
MKSKDFHNFLKFFKNLDKIIYLNLNFCKLIKWNNLSISLHKMVTLKKLSIIQVQVSCAQLISVLNSLKCLKELSFTLPKPDSKQNDKFDCFLKLSKLEIDISNHVLLLPFIIEHCLNLTDLKLMNLKYISKNSLNDYPLNINKLNKLENILITNNKNVIIDRNVLLDRMNRLLKEFQLNFKQDFQIVDIDINVSLNDSLEWLKTIRKPLESFDFAFNFFKSNQIQSSNSNLFLQFDIESFIKNLSSEHLKAMGIKIISNSCETKIRIIINEIKYLRNFHFLRVLDLSQIHIHINYNFCDILTDFKCCDCN